MIKGEVGVLASEFWTRVGDSGPFPRNLERAVVLSLPVSIVKLATLTIERISDWLRDRGSEVAVPICEGEMAGCIVAHRGHAIIFLTGTDSLDEQRATLAHEIAHFLRHYLLPREDALRALGPSILDVLDGHRGPTFAERAQSVIRNIAVGVHVHVLPRAGYAGMISRIEREADELALQLVAPEDVVLEFLRSPALRAATGRERQRALANHFGLPREWFRAHVSDQPPQPRDRLGALVTQLKRKA